MLETKISDLTVDEFRALVRDIVRQELVEMRSNANEDSLQKLDDPKFPLITYRRGGSGMPRPVIRGTAIHVEAIVQWIKFGETPEAVAQNYDLDIKQVQEAQAFYKVHKKEIDQSIKEVEDLERQHIEAQRKAKEKENVKAKTPSR